MVVEGITVNSAFFNNFLDCNFIQRLFIQERNKCRLDSRLGKCRHSVPPENCKTSVCRRIFPFRIFSYTIYAADCYTNQSKLYHNYLKIAITSILTKSGFVTYCDLIPNLHTKSYKTPILQ